MRRIAMALFVTAAELPFWLLLYLAIFALAWFCTLIALVCGLLTLGKWSPPPLPQFAGILQAPRQFLNLE